MRRNSFHATLSLAVVMLAAGDSSTGQNSCNLPTETASVTTNGPSVDGVVNRIRVGGVGNTPGGYDPWTQVDVFVSIPVDDATRHASVDIIRGN